MADETRTRDWQAALFPEANQKPHRETLKGLTHTLQTLGMRASAEAAASGYILIRPFTSHLRPGLWVHERDMEALERLAQAVTELREKRKAEVEERDRRAEALRERKRQTALKVVSELGFLIEEDLERVRRWAETMPDVDIILPRFLTLLRPYLVKRIAASAGVTLTEDAKNFILGTHPVTFHLWDEEVKTGLELGRLSLPGEVTQVTADYDLEGAIEVLRAHYATTHAEAVAKREGLLETTLRAIEERLPELPEAQQNAWKDAARQAFAKPFSDPQTIRRDMERLAERLEFERKLAAARAAPTWVRIEGGQRHVLISAKQRLTLEFGTKPYSTTASVSLSGDDWDKLLLLESTEDFIAAAEAGAAKGIAKKEASWRYFESGLQTILAEASHYGDYPLEQLQERIDDHSEGVQPKRLGWALEDVRRLHKDIIRNIQETQAVQMALAQHNLASFKDFFTIARRLKRTLTLFVGPTNSGKTYHAFNELVKHDSGIYLAPLRLLALEGQEELEKRGVKASFLTGEERDIREDAPFISATIEMLSTDTPVDCAVIDEAQLLADRHRGWAWSRAVLGAPASRVIMTGSPDSIPLVQALCDYTGEPLEIVHLQRLTPLKVLGQHTPLERIQPGTAVVAFSRRNVLGLKEALEDKHRVAVIYGNLSPDVRREEARRFRSGEADVLVATDAIAMGLNLPIETVLFFETEKFNGEERVPLTRSEILQIGGRAGRFGKYPTGYVGTVSVEDRRYIKVAFAQDVPLPDLAPVATVQPSFAHVAALADALQTERLTEILTVFKERMLFDSPALVTAAMTDILDHARTVDAAPLSLEDKFVFATAPVDSRNDSIRAQYERYVWAFAKDQPSRAPTFSPGTPRRGGAPDDDRLYRAEIAVKTLTLYAWLAYRYPKMFPELEACNDLRRELNELIETLLKSKGLAKRCPDCGKSLPPLHAHPRCDNCFRKGRHFGEESFSSDRQKEGRGGRRRR